jgi:hypothetical protein
METDWSAAIGPEYGRMVVTLVDRLRALEGWLPTPANVNALPEGIRRYIHDLGTRSGWRRTNHGASGRHDPWPRCEGPGVGGGACIDQSIAAGGARALGRRTGFDPCVYEPTNPRKTPACSRPVSSRLEGKTRSMFSSARERNNRLAQGASFLDLAFSPSRQAIADQAFLPAH